jgi:hypothetical protein
VSKKGKDVAKAATFVLKSTIVVSNLSTVFQ